MDSKRRSFKALSHKDLLTINNNESVFFGSKMDKTKHKPSRATDFFRFFARNYSLHLEHIFKKKKINTRNRILLCKSNNQIIKSKTQSRFFFLG